jgi:hypothetical protein
MKKLVILLVLVVTTGLLFGQNAVEITVNFDLNQEIDVCVDSEPLNLSTIIDGEWSGSGVVNNIFYPATVQVGTTNILNCGERKISLTVHPILVVSIGWTPKEIDLGKSFQITGYPEGGKWYSNGELFDGNFKPESKGIYEIIYIFKSKHGCESTKLFHINVK